MFVKCHVNGWLNVFVFNRLFVFQRGSYRKVHSRISNWEQSRAEARQVEDGRSCCVTARAAVTLWRKADVTSKVSLPSLTGRKGWG